MSSFSRHWEFVKEISAPLRKPEPKLERPKIRDIFEDDFDIQAELEAKFDELFGSIDDDDDEDEFDDDD